MQVSIIEGCIACGLCESICPEVFTVYETAHVNSVGISGFELECHEAAKSCPVNVIRLLD